MVEERGLMFLAVMLVAHFAVDFRTSSWREYWRQLRLLASGLLPGFLTLVYFKLMVAPPSDLFALAGKQPLVAKLADPERYLLIATEVAQRIVPHDLYGFGFVLALAFWAACARRGTLPTPGVALGALTLFLLFMGYVAVYVVTPYPLAWHLATSIDRVLLQMWPMFVFVYFLIVATPEEILRSSAEAGRKPPGVGGAN